MSELKHNGQVVSEIKEGFQTQTRGSNAEEYEIYKLLANDGNGIDIATGMPIKSYSEWLDS